MLGGKSHVSPLQARKQLLIAESEINRTLLVDEIALLAEDVRDLGDRASTITSIASTAAIVVTGLAALKRGRSVETGAKPSRFQTFLKGAGLVSSLWLAFRARKTD